MFGKSGKYLLLMTNWWILPVFVIHLPYFPLWANLPSYYPFFIAFIISGIFSLGCGLVEAKTGWWSRAGYWKKYFVLNGLYFLNIFLIFSISVTLHDHRKLSYFGGDAEGSFVLGYPYSIILYLLAGIILGVWKHFRKVK